MRKQNKSRKSRQSATGKSLIPRPPPIKGLELKHSTTLRYVTNGPANEVNGSGIITFQNLLDTLVVATTNVAGSDLFTAVKIRRVRIWQNPFAGAATSIRLSYSGQTTGTIGDQEVFTDTSMGIEPAYISAKPSPRSLASNWQLVGGGTAFVLDVLLGAVVDVELSFRSQFYLTNHATQNALAGAVAGTQYIRGLDGLASAATVYIAEFKAAQN